MIAYKHISGPLGGLYCPVVTCDVCEQPITVGGIVMWLVRKDGEVWRNHQVTHAHRGDCVLQLEQRMAKAHPECRVVEDVVTRWLEQLTRNTVKPMAGHAP